MTISPVHRRVSLAVMQAGLRRIDSQIKDAVQANDNRKLEQLLAQRHHAAHNVAKITFPQVQA